MADRRCECMRHGTFSETHDHEHDHEANLSLPEDFSEPLWSKTSDQQLMLVKAQDSVREGRHTLPFYMNQLCRHLDPQLRVKNPSKKLLKGLVSIESLLTSLEVDLRSNPNATWLRDFIDEPNCGHIHLLKLLKYLQDNPSQNSLLWEKLNGRVKKTNQVLVKEQNDEHICILCLKAIVRSKYGFHKVLSAPRSLSTMAVSLRLSNLKTRIVVLKMLSEACNHRGGFEKAIQAFEDYKLWKQERYRFENLVHSVIFSGMQNNPGYQEMVIHFFNALMTNAPSLNERVFHQQELEQAGFSIEKVEQTLDGTRPEALYTEISIWESNYIDVSTTLDEFVILKERSTMLRDEVDLLQSKLEEVGREKNQVQSEKTELEKKVEEYELRASELQSKLEILKQQSAESCLHAQHSTITDEIEDVVEEMLRPAMPPPPPPPPPPLSPMGSLPGSPPLPPPPPPMALNGLPLSKGKGIQEASPSKKLPTLHWQTITSPPENSIFKSLAPQSLAEKLDFSDFDGLFQVKPPIRKTTSAQRESALNKISTQITVLNANKARNLLIARKRIHMDAEGLKQAIDTCDITALLPECAELLLKFPPTSEERTSLLAHSKDLENLAEAEKFMLQLVKIDRLASKLSVMVYMGAFDEHVRVVTPQIEAVLLASSSLATSKKLKELLELVLAYGNYMNGTRRGYIHAFKLDYLLKLDGVKTSDKKTSFLHYLIGVIRSKFPDLHTFHEEIQVNESLNVSMETLGADVQHLRKGLDTMRYERDKQPENYALHNFFTRSSSKVQTINERYRKMEEQFRETCHLFCENPKTTEPSQFFKLFHDFITRYRSATKDIDDKLKEEKAHKIAERLRSQNEIVHKNRIEQSKDTDYLRRHSEMAGGNKTLAISEPLITEHIEFEGKDQKVDENIPISDKSIKNGPSSEEIIENAVPEAVDTRSEFRNRISTIHIPALTSSFSDGSIGKTQL